MEFFGIEKATGIRKKGDCLFLQHLSTSSSKYKILWALSEEAKISSDDYQLKSCADITLTVTVVRISDLSQTKAAGVVFL